MADVALLVRQLGPGARRAVEQVLQHLRAYREHARCKLVLWEGGGLGDVLNSDCYLLVIRRMFWKGVEYVGLPERGCTA